MKEQVIFGLLSTPHFSSISNLGDDIQGLAAQQYLPRVDVRIDRENLHAYQGPPAIVLMNGWFMHKPAHFPPSDRIIPIFESFHLDQHASATVLSEAGIRYLKRHEPIGCRDLSTVQLLQSRGIEAYFSGCLTLTLNRERFSSTQSSGVVISDLLFTYWYNYNDFLERLLDRQLERIRLARVRRKILRGMPAAMQAKTRSVTQFAGRYSRDLLKREAAARRLLEVFAGATLVVTSRLHTALPCLALGTPVLFVPTDPNDPRFSGLRDFLNVASIQALTDTTPSGEFQQGGSLVRWDGLKNTDAHRELASRLEQRVRQRVADAMNR